MTEDTRTSALEARIEDLEAQLDDVHQQLLRAELEQWEGRVDDLEVQVHLASLEMRERLTPLMEALRNRWLDARQQLDETGSTATDTIDALRSGLGKAMDDLRQAVLNAKSAAAG